MEATGARTARVLALVVAAGGEQGDASTLCDVGTRLAGTTGAAVVLAAEGLPWTSVGATGPVSAELAEVQLTNGEGPSIDAIAHRRVVTEPDLVDPVSPRWLTFTARALTAGARAVFAFPLQIGAVRIGTFELQRNRRGPLSDDQHADTLVIATLATRALLLAQANAPAGELAPELETGISYRLVVHQAAGMVAVQVGADVADALVRLRAHAYRTDRPLVDVAADVVARRLRFEDDR